MNWFLTLINILILTESTDWDAKRRMNQQLAIHWKYCQEDQQAQTIVITNGANDIIHHYVDMCRWYQFLSNQPKWEPVSEIIKTPNTNDIIQIPNLPGLLRIECEVFHRTDYSSYKGKIIMMPFAVNKKHGNVNFVTNHTLNNSYLQPEPARAQILAQQKSGRENIDINYKYIVICVVAALMILVAILCSLSCKTKQKQTKTGRISEMRNLEHQLSLQSKQKYGIKLEWNTTGNIDTVNDVSTNTSKVQEINDPKPSNIKHELSDSLFQDDEIEGNQYQTTESKVTDTYNI